MQLPVTIIMPHHGDIKFLGDALKSAISQDYENFQVLLVLDRPDQDVLQFLENFESMKKVKILVSKSPGLVGALNYAISHVESGLVARFDSDDLMAPNRISMQVERFSHSNNLGALGCQLIKIDELGNEIGAVKYPCSNFELRMRINLSSPIAHTALMLPIEVLKDAGGYREEEFPSEDFGLLKRISTKWELENLDQSLVKYRVHNSSTSNTNRYRQVSKSLEIALGVRETKLISKVTLLIIKNFGHFGISSLAMLAIRFPLKVFKFVVYICIFRILHRENE
jgi:glycosyltransferase involved in cell wall biosynthesis